MRRRTARNLKPCRKCGAIQPHSCPPVLRPADVTRTPASRGRTSSYFQCPKCFKPVVSMNEPSRFGVITDTCDACLKVYAVRLKEFEPVKPPTRDTARQVTDPQSDTFGT